MRVFISCAVVAAAAAVLAAQAPAAGQRDREPAPAGSTAPAGDTQNGKKIFGSIGCYECHGYEGQGGAAGARLAPRPIAFASFSRYVRRPTDQMPPYTAKVLSEQELADVYAYLKSIPDPPAVKSLPQLSE